MTLILLVHSRCMARLFPVSSLFGPLRPESFPFATTWKHFKKHALRFRGRTDNCFKTK